jgi:hypothetical protein
MKKKKEDKADGIFAIISAMLVLFTTMINPLYSAALAIILLIIFSVYKFAKK